MAIFEKTIQNKKFDQLLWKLENEIPASSWSAELEAGSDFKEGDARCRRSSCTSPFGWLHASVPPRW